MKNKTILQDHKRIGNTLYPPLLSSDIPLSLGSYTEEILPEIIWIGLINEELGYIQGKELITKFSKLALISKQTDEYFNFAIASNFYSLNQKEKKIFINKLLDENIFNLMSELLSPLIYFYKDCPFSFLNKEVDLSKDEEIELINKLKIVISKHFDRFQKDSNIGQFHIFYRRILDKKISFYQGMVIPDFNAIIESPDSEEAKEASSFIRCSAKNEFIAISDLKDFTYEWSKNFWNQSYKIDDCYIRGIKND